MRVFFKSLMASKTYRSLQFIPITGIAVFVILNCATPSIRVTREQNQGDLLFNNHQYQEAVKHYTLMLDASRRLGIYRNPVMESDVHRKIANCYEMMGNYENALLHVKFAMEIDSLNGNLMGRIADYRQEGKILIYMGLSMDGMKSLEKSLTLSNGMDQSLKNIRFYWIDKDNDIYISIGETMLDPNEYMASIIGVDEDDAALDSTDSELMMLDNPLKSLKEVIKKVNNEYSLSLN